MKIYEFQTELKQSETYNGTYIEFPFDVVECFGKKGQVKVFVEVNGFSYRSSLSSMGYHCHLVVFKKEYRVKTGLKAGDLINVKIHEDKDERTVELPDDIRESLDFFPELIEFFDNMSFTHRKEYVEWITSAKKPETRLNRMEKGIEILQKMYNEKQLKKRKKKS